VSNEEIVPTPQGSALTILIIDDSEMIQGLLKITLQVQDWDIVLATTGQEAIGIACKQKPDLVILDWQLGKQDISTGFETCKAFRDLYPDLPILLISGIAREDDPAIKDALEICASVFIKKPFRPIELIEMVERLLQAPGVNDDATQ
jgi:two-component system, OmpR family, alkaline phosphatase synthesis response regulator PhoP